MSATHFCASRAVLPLALVLAMTTASTAQADPPQSDPPQANPPQANPPQANPPKPANELQGGQHFELDPVTDSVLITVGFGFAGILGLVLGTGEIKPPQPGDPAALLPIDRTAVTQKVDKNANTLSDIGLYAAIGFAVLDPVLSGLRDGWDATLVDALMYAQSISLSLAFTDVVKIAVRRPRPVDYINCPNTMDQAMPPPGCNSTDLGLSFFSGHAAIVSSIGATATYLAFARTSIKSPRPWLTLGVATALTSFVAVERVRSGNHFPTDVIAGALSGAAIGMLIPHLHRHKNEGLPIWVGVSPSPGGGTLTLSGHL
jgi:undecaprenyl-diphosphatase